MPRNLKNQMKVIMFPDALAQPVCMGIKHIMHTHYYPESSVSSTWSHADSLQMRRREGKDAKKRRRRRKMIRIILLQRQLCKHCCCVSSNWIIIVEPVIWIVVDTSRDCCHAHILTARARQESSPIHTESTLGAVNERADARRY